MNKWFLLIFLLLLFGCAGKDPSTYLTSEKAIQYFQSVDSMCNADSGKLWGKNLSGPVMFVDRTTRRIIANRPDNDGILKSKDGVFTGSYPKELIISTSTVKFGGTDYAMAPLPPAEDRYRIKTRAVHGLFHLFQLNEGINVLTFNAANMDEKEARLWIKLEWKALRKALNLDGEERQLAIRDALIFRGSNRERYHKYIEEENKFESSEGLATFTYTLLCTHSQEEFKNRLFENLGRVYSMESYSRSYGSIDGALYAALLYYKGYDMKKTNTDGFDLGNAVKDLYNIQLPAVCRDVAGSLAVNYGIDTINREEATRDVMIKESIDNQAKTFTEKPVVLLELESPSFDFEPEDIRSLASLGTLYNAIRVSDNWGKLTVEKGGCLVSNNLKFIRITARSFKANKDHISGDGWHLILNNDWELVPVEQNYYVRKLAP